MTGTTPPARVLITELDTEQVGSRLAELATLLAAAAKRGGQAGPPELLVASKYFDAVAIPPLIAAGALLLGENRADVLAGKQDAAHEPAAAVRWDYIGELQSRKAKEIAPLVSRIHTLASASAARKLRAHADGGGSVPELLIQVNIAGETGKGGIDPTELPGLLEAADGLPVRGLMTMPPLAADPADNRRWFAALRDLAAAHDLPQLSMGTSQDAIVAAEEGSTVVRIGGLLTSDEAWHGLASAAG